MHELYDKFLFRGKRLSDDMWVFGSLVCYAKLIKIRVTSHEQLDMLDEWIVDPTTVGEYLRCRDKNNERLFKNDIVRDEWERIFRVVYSEHFNRLHLYQLNEFDDWRKTWQEPHYKKIGVHIFDWVYPQNDIEKIGNIYDNPELIINAPELLIDTAAIIDSQNK